MDTSEADLFIAANDGDCGRMLALLDRGAEADESDEMVGGKTAGGKTIQSNALIQAAWKNRQEAINLLLDHRADPNCANSNGMAPLMMAAQEGHLPIVKTLLQHDDAAINAIDMGDYSAFHLACFYANTDCALILAKHGCDMTLRNDNGETGKEMAEKKGRSAPPRTRSC